MKHLAIAAALFASASLAGAPSCAWNDCFESWDGGSCGQSGGWDCLCSNSTAVARLNTCVATSCTQASDQEAIYAAVAQICADNGATVTGATQEATFSATLALSQPTTRPSGWESGAWASWISACSTGLPGAGAGVGAPSGWAIDGDPWATLASEVQCDAWTTWTAGWGPSSSWTGTWSGCSTTTATPLPATVTTMITTGGSTQVLTGTTFGIQAAVSQSASTSTHSSSASGSASSHLPHCVPVLAAIAGGVFAAMIVL